MVWDFTPTQVMKGEVKYTMEDFQRALKEQVKLNFGDKWQGEMLERCYQFFWAYIHLSAVGKTPKEICELLVCPEELAEAVEGTCQEDVKMLIAIYQHLYLQFYPEALRDSWGDEEKAVDRSLASLNLYISRHVK